MVQAFRTTPVDIAGSQLKGLQARNARAQLDENTRLRESRNALAERLQGGFPTDQAGRQQLIGAAANVDPSEAVRFKTMFDNMDQNTFNRRKATAPLVKGILGNVKNQAEYDLALPVLRQYDDFNDLPDAYDPQSIGTIVRAAQFIDPDPNLLTPEAMKQKIDIANKSRAPKVLSPEAEAQKIRIAQAGKTDISLGTQEKEEQKAFGKYLVSNYEKIQEEASAAEDTISQIAIARSIPIQSGALEPTRSAAAAFAQALGFAPTFGGLDRAASAQAFTGIMNNMVLTKMQAQKGPQTENDAARIEATLARLGNTPAANKFLFRSAEALAMRAVEQASFYRQFRERTGSLDGAESAWSKHKRDTPLVGTHPKTKQPVFYHEFEREVRRVNRGATRKQILQLWRSKYD